MQQVACQLQHKPVSRLQDAWLNDTPDEDIVQIVKYIANFYNSISAAADPLQVGGEPGCCAIRLNGCWASRQRHKGSQFSSALA